MYKYNNCHECCVVYVPNRHYKGAIALSWMGFWHPRPCTNGYSDANAPDSVSPTRWSFRKQAYFSQLGDE